MLNVALVFFLLKKFLRFKFGRHPKKSTAQTLCNPRGCLTSGPHHSWLLSLKRLTLPQYMAYGRNAVQIETVPYFFSLPGPPFVLVRSSSFPLATPILLGKKNVIGLME